MTYIQLKVLKEHDVTIGFLATEGDPEVMQLRTVSFSRSSIPQDQWNAYRDHYNNMITELNAVIDKYKEGPKHA